MNDYLHQHPEIYMAPKELHYFGQDLQMRNRISEKEYLEHFQRAGDKKIFGEASVWYLFSKEAAKEIKDYVPQAKILVMLRNPVDVIYSLHSQRLYDGNEDVVDFEVALGLDEDRKKGIHLPRSTDFFEPPPYGDSVLFSEQVRRYLDVFDENHLQFVLYEDFIRDTKAVVSEVLKFLGVDTDVRITYNLVNPNKQIQSFYIHRLMKHPSSKLKKVVRLALPARKLRHEFMGILFRWNAQIRRRKEMNPLIKAKLKKFLADDINSLSKLIDKDLSMWIK